jgi:hypothetical protein
MPHSFDLTAHVLFYDSTSGLTKIDPPFEFDGCVGAEVEKDRMNCLISLAKYV